MDTRDQIHAIIAEHCGGDVEAATNEICGLLGIAPDTWHYAGWTVCRKSGADFGKRGAVRTLYGWTATHDETGHTEEFPPSSAEGDIPVNLVRRMLDTKNEFYSLAGRFTLRGDA